MPPTRHRDRIHAAANHRASHDRRMRKLILLFCTAALALQAAGTAPKSHRDFRTAAEAAYQRKDYAAAREAFASALQLRPDSPRYLHDLAAVSALAGDPGAALDLLRRLAALGVATPVERDPDFASLQGRPEFRQVLQAIAENRSPRGEAEVLAELPGRTGIIEGIAFRVRTSDLFLGDAHHRCIWRRDRDGRVSRFTAVEDEDILGVFGLVLDEARNTLWAAMAALPEMSGYTAELKGLSALGEFNLATGELRRAIPVPDDGHDHLLGDLVLAPDGTIYATDSATPIVWQFAPGAEELEKVAELPPFSSLQGLVLVRRKLLVADYANGLVAIDLATGSFAPLSPPPNTTLLGLDGLVPVPGGIVAIQNGVDPQRAIRIAVSPDLTTVTAVTVLAAALPQFGDLTLVTLVNERPVVIAGAGWEGFDPAKTEHPRAHAVRIFQIALP
jgi:tetratricopeptide (TPR) repeat protein